MKLMKAEQRPFGEDEFDNGMKIVLKFCNAKVAPTSSQTGMKK